MGTSRRSATALAGGVLATELAAVAVMLVLDIRLEREGYGDRLDTLLDPWVWLIVVAALSPAVVGLLIVRSHPRHAVGWLFLALSTSILLAGALEEWFIHAAVVDPPEIGGATVAATLADKVFVPWWPLLTLILLLTPTGTHLSDRWRAVGRASVVASVLFFALAITSDRPLNGDYGLVDNPWAVPAISPYTSAGADLAFAVVAGCLLLAGASLVVRWRRGTDDERRRLLWLVLAVVPLPAVVPVHLVAVTTENEAFVLVTLGLFLALIPAVAGLSVLRFRLYDVDRIVAATTTYSVVSLLLTAIYVGVVWFGSHLTSLGSPSPAATATVGAVAAATLFAPLRGGVQRRVDHRFNRRAFEAVRMVREALADERAGLDPEALLRAALGDQSVRLAYPGPDGWVDASGAAAPEPDDHVEVTRGGRVVARVGFAPDLTDPTTVSRVGALAAAELDNTRLRADLQRHLSELAASRARIADAQREERRRIERDLHDGAQQTLLALAFELQAAQLNGEPDAMRAALAHGADGARAAAKDLRDLANGLHPTALVDGGLAGVIDDLARRSPVPIDVDLDVDAGDRLDGGTEWTAWLVVAEAVTNAHKHAAATRIQVASARTGGELRLTVRDDGRGGADPSGSGLRGLHDRVASAGGTLEVHSDSAGTTVEVRLPCGS